MLLFEVKIQEDIKMYSQLPDYDDFRGFGLAKEAGLAAISKRIYEGSANPSWLTLKNHLLSIHIPQTLFKSLREIPIRKKKDEFKK